MLRVANEEDIAEIVEVGKIMHAESRYSSQVYDPGCVADSIRNVMRGNGAVFVVEHEGSIVGGIICCISRKWFNNELSAGELALFVKPENRQGMIAVKLISAFKKWAKAMGATEIIMGITTQVNQEGAERLYLATGFDEVGKLFKYEVT